VNPFVYFGLSREFVRATDDIDLMSIVETRYKVLAQMYHPDKGGSGEDFRELAIMRDVLRDGARFAKYKKTYVRQTHHERLVEQRAALCDQVVLATMSVGAYAEAFAFPSRTIAERNVTYQLEDVCKEYASRQPGIQSGFFVDTALRLHVADGGLRRSFDGMLERPDDYAPGSRLVGCIASHRPLYELFDKLRLFVPAKTYAKNDKGNLFKVPTRDFGNLRIRYGNFQDVLGLLTPEVKMGSLLFSWEKDDTFFLEGRVIGFGDGLASIVRLPLTDELKPSLNAVIRHAVGLPGANSRPPLSALWKLRDRYMGDGKIDFSNLREYFFMNRAKPTAKRFDAVLRGLEYFLERIDPENYELDNYATALLKR